MQQCIEQAAAHLLTNGQARLKSVAEGHQFIKFGDDAVCRTADLS